jgi:outer membrane protein assembly factor BamB
MNKTVLAITSSCALVSCDLSLDTPVDSEPATPAPTASAHTATPRPTIAPPQVQVEGALGEHLIPVKLPAVKGNEPTKFRIGRENEHEAWIAQIPEHSPLVSVAYGGGKIFVGGGFGANTMYALDAKTGKRVWTAYELADPGPTPPVYDNEELAFNTFSCSLEVVDAKTGRTKWAKNIGSETPIQPALVGDLVIAPHPMGVSAYKRKNGAQVWMAELDGHTLTGPVVHGDSVYVATLSGTLYRVGLDGRTKWSRSVNAASAPWIDGDQIHIAARSGSGEQQIVLSAIDGKKLRTVTSTKSENSYPSGGDENAWAYDGFRPVVKDGVRYMAMGDRVEARDAATDELKWTRSGGKHKVDSVVIAGSLAIVTSKDGSVVGLDRATGAQRMGLDLGTPVQAEPIVAQGWMYVATQRGQIISFDLGNESFDGWHMWGGNAQHNL